MTGSSEVFPAVASPFVDLDGALEVLVWVTRSASAVAPVPIILNDGSRIPVEIIIITAV